MFFVDLKLSRLSVYRLKNTRQHEIDTGRMQMSDQVAYFHPNLSISLFVSTESTGLGWGEKSISSSW